VKSSQEAGGSRAVLVDSKITSNLPIFPNLSSPYSPDPSLHPLPPARTTSGGVQGFSDLTGKVRSV